jgi:hypothetical protein
LYSIKLTRVEFLQWLGKNNYELPTFWQLLVRADKLLNSASKMMIRKAICDVYDLAEANGENPPNIRLLAPAVQERLEKSGHKASSAEIQRIGGAQEFAARRRRPGERDRRK